MDERAHAIRILKRTREILSQRLTERILEAEEEILAEAEGHSFLSEIESLYDQIGLRLTHVNQMLAHLPPTPEAAPAEAKPHPRPMESWPAVGPRPPLERGGPGTAAEGSISALLALPAPGPARTGVGELASSTLLMFAVHARRGEVETAALALESLFGLSRERALAGARAFHGQCVRDPAYVENAALLQNYLAADALSRAFGLLCESFGLGGGEALSALMWWRTRTAR